MTNNFNMSKELPQTISNIVLYYIKKQYNIYLKDNNLTKIPEDEIKTVVENFYSEKELDLKKIY